MLAILGLIFNYLINSIFLRKYSAIITDAEFQIWLD